MRLRINLEGQSYDVEVELLPDGAAAPVEPLQEVVLPDFPPPPIDIREQDLTLKSPIAGLVVSIEAQPGQKVKRDDTLLIIEAMKMLISIGAQAEGTVEEFSVKAGDSVMPGQTLLRLS